MSISLFLDIAIELRGREKVFCTSLKCEDSPDLLKKLDKKVGLKQEGYPKDNLFCPYVPKKQAHI